MSTSQPKYRFQTAGVITVVASLTVIGWIVAAEVDPGIAPRRASSFHLLSLSQYADKAVESWLKQHRENEEDIAARRYFYGDIDGDRTNDLLLVTSLPLATGNYWSQDFILIRAAAPSQPILLKYGGKGGRSYEELSMDSKGIHVDALYYGKSDADCCPTIKKKVDIVLKGGALVERSPK